MLALDAIQKGHVFKFRLLNTAFITLLPKKADPIRVKDYRLISLIHSFAKLVAKIMANNNWLRCSLFWNKPNEELAFQGSPTLPNPSPGRKSYCTKEEG
jgi:hypothetical protein